MTFPLSSSSDTAPAAGAALVVDDNGMMRTVLGDVLRGAGFMVHTASNGEECVSLYRQDGDGIDLVLLDLEMPVMDGGEAYRRLCALDPDVNIIVISSCTPEQAWATLQSEEVPYLRKPVAIDALLAEIRRMAPAAEIGTAPTSSPARKDKENIRS